jgi:hypothetical protein
VSDTGGFAALGEGQRPPVEFRRSIRAAGSSGMFPDRVPRSRFLIILCGACAFCRRRREMMITALPALLGAAVHRVGLDVQVLRNLLDEHLVEQIGQVGSATGPRLQRAPVEHDPGA